MRSWRPRDRRRRDIAPLLVVLVAVGSAATPGAASSEPAQRSSAAPLARQHFTEQELRTAPAARDVWALLEHQAPAVVSQRLDVGGSATGVQGLASARSTSWRENVYRLDGIDTTDPAVRGTSALFYDYDAFAEVAVSWGAQPASVGTAGVLLDMAVQRGGDAWHGAGQGHFTLDALQADSAGDVVAGRGAGPASQIDYLSDVSLQLGGPLVDERAGIFASYRDGRIARAVPVFDEAVTTSLPVLTAKLTARATENDALALTFARQRYTNPARNAGPFVEPEATAVEDSTTVVLGGHWTHDFDGGAPAGGAGGVLQSLAARGSWLDIDLPLRLQPGATRPSRLDIVTQVRSGSAPLEIVSARRRYAGELQLRFNAEAGAARNDMLAGGQVSWAPTRTGYRAIDDVNIFTANGGALAAHLLNTPVDSRQNARALALFLHDEVAIGSRWSAFLGLRYDDWSGSLPAQSSAAGRFTPARSFAAQDGIIGWRRLTPRLNIAFDPLANGELVVTAGYAQYAHQLSTATVRFGNPNAPAVTVVSWTDLNEDGRFQPGEGGAPVVVSGGAAGIIASQLDAPLTHELHAGLALELGDGWRARTDLWYRKDDRLFDDVEAGLTPDDFAEEVVTDPGRDNVPGTGDDAGLRVFNQIEGFGANQRLLRTVAEKTVTYKGIDLSLERTWADDWTLRAALTVALAEGASGKSGLVPGDAGGISDLFDDPNSLTNAGINGTARTFWDRPYVLKVYGAYALPRGFMLAGVLRSWAGAPLGRILPVALNQGIVNVWAEPRGAQREPALTTADVRVAKDLELARRARLSLYVDMFNVTNAATVTRTLETVPLFGVPAEIVAPFVVRLGARIGF